MRHSIMMGILLCLLNKKKVTKKYLSERFEIAPRTVSRYIDALGAAGVPVISILGKNGGYSIYDNYKIDKTFFSQSEKSRLIACVLAMKTAFNDTVNNTLLEKLENLKSGGSENFFVESDTLVVDAGGWKNHQLYRANFSVISKAINTQTRLKINYRDKYGLDSTREINPHSLVLKEGIWYVYAYCLRRNDFRLFKLSRMRGIILLNEHFERVKSDVYSKLYEEFETNYEIDLELEFNSLRLADIEEWLGSDAILDRGLKCVAVASVNGGSQLLSKLLGFGSDVKVISPAYLREELLTECRRLLRFYGIT